MSRSKNAWKEFFQDKKHGGHRYSDEEFLAMEAKEKLFHLDGGKTLLDFGCGAAELLVFYASKYDRLVGVDFSESMLGQAGIRITEKKCSNIELILADDKTVWEKVNSKFDRITAAGVIQYLTFEEIDNFILNSSKHLNNNGKIVLFDILDPRLYLLWKIGYFSENAGPGDILLKIGYQFKNMLLASLQNRPRDILGIAHNSTKLQEVVEKHGFKMIRVQSMYYEYKYHAIIFRS
ncbi:MAG: class I SAM-dependent methyltransferase [Methanosarcina sp.]